MSASIPEFWKLLGESRLLPAELIQQYHSQYANLKGAPQEGSARTLAEWLVSVGALTRYQIAILLGGRSGPFLYGEYKIVDRYESGRLAGHFRAIHMPSGYVVLLSFLTGAVTSNENLWNLAAENAERLRAIVHPNLVRFFELVDVRAYKFIAVEDMTGETAGKILPSGSGLPFSEAARMVRLAALGLDHLHGAGLVHGEVRPKNMWVEKRGNLKLLGVPLTHDLITAPGQFNLSSAESNPQMQEAADYLAPELAHFGATATPQTDIYSLGCSLYEILTGAPPFAGGTVQQKIERHATQPIQPLQNRGVPAPLEQTVAYMMAKDPNVRFQSMNQVAEALTQFVDPAALAPRPEPPQPNLAVYENLIQQNSIQLAKKAGDLGPLPEIDDSFTRITGHKSDPEEARRRAAERLAKIHQPKTGFDKFKDFARSPMFLIGSFALLFVITASVLFAIVPGEQGQQVTVREEDKNVHAIVKEEATKEDDGVTFWASPTTGQPLNLKYVPLGSQIFIAIRPKELLAHKEGERISAALSESNHNLFRDLEMILFNNRNLDQVANTEETLDLQDIQQVLIALEANLDGSIHPTFVVHLGKEVSRDQLLTHLDNPKRETHNLKSYFLGKQYAYYLPTEEENRVFVVAQPEKIVDVIELGDTIPPLPAKMEEMLVDTDSDRMLTIMFPPKHIFGDASKAIFQGPIAKIRDSLKAFFGSDNIEAAIFSCHLSHTFFMELRLAGTVDMAPKQLAQQTHQHVDDLYPQVRNYTYDLNSHPYAKQLILNFPDMVRILSRYTRDTVEHDQALLRAYLPSNAAHNLLMSTELTLAQTPGAGGTVIASAEGSKTTREKLKSKASLSFPRDTLEVSIQLLSKESGIEMEILGNDLKLDGITKNQSFGIDLKDQPVEDILLKIMMLANPDKSVKSPNEEGQKLIYVVKPKQPGGEEMVFITTRQMAVKRNDPLPKPFVLE